MFMPVVWWDGDGTFTYAAHWWLLWGRRWYVHVCRSLVVLGPDASWSGSWCPLDHVYLSVGSRVWPSAGVNVFSASGSASTRGWQLPRSGLLWGQRWYVHVCCSLVVLGPDASWSDSCALQPHGPAWDLRVWPSAGVNVLPLRASDNLYLKVYIISYGSQRLRKQYRRGTTITLALCIGPSLVWAQQ